MNWELDVTPVEQFDTDIACMHCDWSGLLSECPVEREQDGWEMPSYLVPICPECGEVIEI